MARINSAKNDPKETRKVINELFTRKVNAFANVKKY